MASSLDGNDRWLSLYLILSARRIERYGYNEEIGRVYDQTCIAYSLLLIQTWRSPFLVCALTDLSGAISFSLSLRVFGTSEGFPRD